LKECDRQTEEQTDRVNVDNNRLLGETRRSILIAVLVPVVVVVVMVVAGC